jgi:exodeoxyribonuclease V beta subunit
LDAKHIINNTLTLSENRRSHPHIINFINQLFGNDNNNECFGRGINYDKIEARVSFEKLVQLPEIEQLRLITNKHGITDYKISSSPVQIITISGNKADEKEEQLTFALVSEILLLLNANPNLAQSMAILVPEHKDAVKIVKKLSEYGVKASLSKRENIFATKTAEDLYKILEATINLSNVNLLKKALATYLFNIPYYNLNNFIDNSSSILGDRSISECFYAYKEALVTHDIMSLIYLLISDLKLIYLHHKIKLSNREIANLIQLGELIHKNCFHMISQMELLYWFRNKMQDVVNGKSNDADLDGVNEELVRLDNDEKQIKVMTQHTSKGLEFDILFCPNFKKKLYNITTLTHLHETGELKKSELGFLKYRDLSNMQYNNMQYNVLSYDGNKLKLAHKEDDYEVNRLNYVTLTRAKSRLYIYLTEITKTSRGKIEKYYGNSKPSKIDELFGFNCRDTKDLSHRLFNYPQLFRDPKSAIKDKASLPGVDVYSRSLIDSSILNKLKLQAPNILLDDTRECVVEDDINFRVKFSRQSYSSIVRKSEQQMFSLTNNDLGDELIQEENNTEIELEPICYRYSVLNQLKGAKFGLLIHSLCENYPLNREITENLLINANISLEYCDDLMQITNEIFYYKILHENVSLKEIKNRINELAFCLKIKSEVVIEREIKIILGQFYGENHPYTIECNKLDIIRSGFLSGFIDVFFEHNGKYYVLDYKTNSLDDYTSSFNINNVTNPLLIQTANHHYYLQYLLYLVAVKRYLEFKLNIDDASDFLGGAIYFYVRGIFVDNDGKKGGILIDDSCQKVVSYLDQLFIK